MDRLLEVAGEQRGFVLTSDAAGVGVDRAKLSKLASRGRLIRLGYGMYRLPTFPSQPNDDVMEAVMWTGKRGVIAGESALALHDLADVNPRKIEIVVPLNYHPRRSGGATYRVRQCHIPVAHVDDVAGIPVMDPYTAIKDAIDTGVDHRHIRQAITTAARRLLIDPDQQRELAAHLDEKEG